MSAINAVPTASSTAAPAGSAASLRRWSQHLQRRVMRLLLLHNQRLFRGQFSSFYADSDLPDLPLFNQYDRFLTLLTLSDELLDDILPRIRRQLSLQTDRARLKEHAPTRGDIDWPRTIQRGWRETPGLPPLEFDTRLRQRSTATPENLFTVAVLLSYRRALHTFLAKDLEDEQLTAPERQILTSADEQAERELTAAYARAMLDLARSSDIETLAAQVEGQLRPGPNPYRDLLAWWWRFAGLRVGRGAAPQSETLAPKRTDEKSDAWLYELWIMLELIHLLNEAHTLAPRGVSVTTNQLSITFTWGGQHLRLTYNRQADASAGANADWSNSPGVRPDYTIERINQLQFTHNNDVIWREPPIILDAKYYLSGSDPERTHGPIKKLLGDMMLIGASQCILFFPLLPEPPAKTPFTRTVERPPARHHAGVPLAPHIHLCHLAPEMPVADLQGRLHSVLDRIGADIAARASAIRCYGICLDADTISPNGSAAAASGRIICPKPHIGPDVYDLVARESDCLRNPRLCHVIGQAIVPPFVVRPTSADELRHQTGDLRARIDAPLHQYEETKGDDSMAQAEQLRSHIFTGVGRAIEQYVKLRGNTQTIEEHLEQWVFGDTWRSSPRALAEETRKMLISGEYVRQEYAQNSSLDDWAAPAIQYCRALELELRRRLYNHRPSELKLGRAGWTLGSPVHAFGRHDANANHNWTIFMQLVAASRADAGAFERILKRIVDEDIKDKRNHLAHGAATPRAEAEVIRAVIIGSRREPGVLSWLVENLDGV